MNLQENLQPLFEKLILDKKELIQRLEKQRVKDAREKELKDF